METPNKSSASDNCSGVVFAAAAFGMAVGIGTLLFVAAWSGVQITLPSTAAVTTPAPPVMDVIFRIDGEEWTCSMDAKWECKQSGKALEK